ncbi:ComF family protein [Fodinicola acaciae]|uniref:ComF family protein n=1 Tax=Fodinicola acaciae TaxID=2681555 RepID=UPI0013D67576|nr:phosphoribosyltransferase family protein [Fodinicola acaciae]
MATTARDLARSLADLVLPVRCAGCGLRDVPLCDACRWWLERPARQVVPTPCPPDMPVCFAVAPYAGPPRQTLLAYKERGRHRLAKPLGGALTRAVGQAGGGRPVLLVPVPSTAAAVRARGGDHLRPLVEQVLRRVDGRLAEVLTARPRPDSAGLSSAARAANRVGAFGFRTKGRRLLSSAVRDGYAVVIVDDLVTTGATLAEINRVLTAEGAPPSHSAVIAATVKRSAHIRSPGRSRR